MHLAERWNVEDGEAALGIVGRDAAEFVDGVGTNFRPLDLVGDVAHEHLVAGGQAADRRHEVGRRAADPGSFRQPSQ